MPILTSSYINWSVRADLPTPPDPTIMTLWRAGAGGFFLAPDMVVVVVLLVVAVEVVVEAADVLLPVRSAR